jgi:hypothetical protein
MKNKRYGGNISNKKGIANTTKEMLISGSLHRTHQTHWKKISNVPFGIGETKRTDVLP